LAQTILARVWFGPNVGNILYLHSHTIKRSYIFRFLACLMSFSPDNVQQKCKTLVPLAMLVAALCTAFCALHAVLSATSSSCGGPSLEIDIELVLVLLGVLVYFLHSRNMKSIDNGIYLSKVAAAESVIGKAGFDRSRDACCAASVEERAPPQKPRITHSIPKGSQDQLGQDKRGPRHAVRIIESAQREGVAHTLPNVAEVMRASIRLGRGGVAVKLFNHMLKEGAVPGAHLIDKAVSNNFFQLVIETLDDKRIQRDGVSLLDLVRAHGLDPSPSTQNRVLSAWNDQPPQIVMEYFVKMHSDRVNLSNWAYRSMIVAYEHSDPAFVVKVSKEMERSGIQLQRKAYNAVLGACLQLGMHNEAEHLFGNMAGHAVAPNARTYGIMIRVYSFSYQFAKAIGIFDAMREQSFQPDRFAYHHTIQSCIKHQRVEYAVELYKDSVQAKVPLCTSTYVILIRACKEIGWELWASTFEMELTSQRTALTKEAEAAHTIQA